MLTLCLYLLTQHGKIVKSNRLRQGHVNNLNDSADISASNWLRQNSYTLQIRLREMSAVERWIRIFWLLGPFILLIERTPADVWLSSLALLFLGRAAIQRDFRFLKVGWVRLAFLFWLS